MNKLIIFDFDDTIIDNSKIDYQSFYYAVKKLNLKFISKKKFSQLRKEEYTSKQILQKIKIDNDKLIQIQKIRMEFLKNSESLKFIIIKNKLRLLLYLLHKKKIHCILCSSNMNDVRVKKFLKYKKLNKYFKKMYFTKDLALKIDNSDKRKRVIIKKELIRKVLEDFKIPKIDMIYVGNSYEDYTASKKMKIKYVHFQNEYLKRNSFDDVDIIKNIYEIVKIIQ